MAAFILSSEESPISARRLHQTLGITYKSAWLIEKRILYAMKSQSCFNGEISNGMKSERMESPGRFGKASNGTRRGKKALRILLNTRPPILKQYRSDRLTESQVNLVVGV
jgi:hypothetical protein